MSRPATLGLLAALALGTPAIASAAPQHDVTAQVTTSLAPAPSAAATTESSSYAQREHKDAKVANYEGGSVVVIGASGAAVVVLLLVLLLVI